MTEKYPRIKEIGLEYHEWLKNRLEEIMIPESMRKELEILGDIKIYHSLRKEQHACLQNKEDFMAGANAIFEMLVGMGSEFNLNDAMGEGFYGSPDPLWSEQSRFVEGARWQHQKLSAVFAAKMAEKDAQIEFMNKNCISLSLHESRVQALESEIAELERVLEIKESRESQFKSTMKANIEKVEQLEAKIKTLEDNLSELTDGMHHVKSKEENGK